jgi:hypothetical protein
MILFLRKILFTVYLQPYSSDKYLFRNCKLKTEKNIKMMGRMRKKE